MRNIWTIAKREFTLYFASPIAYTVTFLLLFVVGLVFALTIINFSSNSGMTTGAPSASVITNVVAFLIMWFVPALTMRLVADEIRMGTMELLQTAPIRDYELIVGKWLGALLFLLVPIAVTLVFPLLFNSMVENGIDQKAMMAAYLGVILVAAALLAIGVAISALFSNQIAAFFVTMVIFIVFWYLIGIPASFLHAGADIFRYLSFSTPFYDNFNQGNISLTGLVYYLSLTALGLFVGSTAVEIRRWR